MASRPAEARSRVRLAAALCALLPSFFSGSAAAALRVVATLPDVADMARQIGGDRVRVETIARGSQDPHKVPVKPSFVTKLNRADALVVQGLGLEHSFLPALLEVANNPKILPTGPAYIDASVYVKPLEVPSRQDRSQGELHPLGNPHFNLDPVRGKWMAKAIADGLARVDPDGAAEYQAGLVRFTELLDRKIAEWEQLAAPRRGVEAVSNQRDLV
jgi:zinc/manganese transport system substrate-binding protein